MQASPTPTTVIHNTVPSELRATVSQLNIYPVKSLQGISLPSVEVTPQGLRWDRHWMIVNEDGMFATQRHLPNLARISTDITEEHLILSAEGIAPLAIPLKLKSNSVTKRSVKVWKSDCEAIEERHSSEWLTNVIGKWRNQSLSLVRMAPNFNRAVSEKHLKGKQATTYFADGYPFLITNTASLISLNQQLISRNESPVPMSRFRSNIVLDSQFAFCEHSHTNMRINRVSDNTELLHFDLCKPCERCKVTSIDQLTGISPAPQQPLKTLLAMDHIDKKGAFFGQNAILTTHLNDTSKRQNNRIRIGDTVILSSQNNITQTT
ncbi:MOSC domain-containing protein [Flocculibacter collagenilyticus]|uniref:MOSC domain-containing protein n=1 Tax=Flocculibacter collagenilyticus TaxID=2744479 RepID=UPI0018F623A9|nr:MOSC N-terminal beta barrel domain-containing protein [Flocculibacter collagenilyticus]